LSTLIPIGLVVLILVSRNSRPRRLRIETLWLTPVIYVALLGPTLFYAPPPITPISLGLLALSATFGAVAGWQRGRFTRIDIHPETHDITARQSTIGLVFIVAILAVRVAGRDFLAAYAEALHLPVIAALDAFFIFAIVMLSAQRLEVWLRASKMLADAKVSKLESGPPSTPPIVR
jgi:hypothetical protein